MAFLKTIIGGAVKGVKTIVANARIGAQAKAAGFIQPSAQDTQRQQVEAVQAKTQGNVIAWVSGGAALLFALILIFKKK